MRCNFKKKRGQKINSSFAENSKIRCKLRTFFYQPVRRGGVGREKRVLGAEAESQLAEGEAASAELARSVN